MHLSFQSLAGTGLSVAVSGIGDPVGGAYCRWCGDRCCWRHLLQPAVSRG